MILTHLVLFSFLAGASAADAPPAAAETFSGGWSRTESRAKREARIKSERVKLGIIEPDAPNPAEGEAAGEAITGVPASRGGVTPPVPPPVPPPLPLHPGLAVDLAELYTSAYLDEEIKRHFWLQDDDDTAMLLIAIATLH